MTKKLIEEEITKAKPVITELLNSNYDFFEAEKFLLNYDLSIVNTIQLLMYMGENAQYNRRKKPYKNPIATFNSWVKYMGAYDNTDKAQEVECIVGKQDYKSYITTAVKLLSI